MIFLFKYISIIFLLVTLISPTVVSIVGVVNDDQYCELMENPGEEEEGDLEEPEFESPDLYNLTEFVEMMSEAETLSTKYSINSDRLFRNAFIDIVTPPPELS